MNSSLVSQNSLRDSLSSFLFGLFMSPLRRLTYKYVPVRSRYLLTRHNRLRLRYVCSVAVVALFLGAYSIQGAGLHSFTSPQALAGLEPAAGIANSHGLQLERFLTQAGSVVSGYRDQQGHLRRDPSMIETAAVLNSDQDQPVDPLAPRQLSLKIGKGDTLGQVLQEAGVDSADANNLVQAMKEHINPRSIRAGQALDVVMAPVADANNRPSLALTQVSYVVDPLKTLHVRRQADGSMDSKLDEKPVEAKRMAMRVDIDGSLYGSASRAGVPDKVVGNAIKLFSYTVDFQRDIRDGDRLEVMYDSYVTADGYVAKTGDIQYARMILGGREYPIYRYENKDGRVDYYTPDGRNVLKSSTLMKTPIDGARMSSGFGVRRHPVLGYTKMHKGIDFAAPTGTPIYAAGDGVVERAGRFSSFGNYIKIRHNSKLHTAYAHLSRFASGVRPGRKVQQGQIIGYVGTTGRSTGPHLHYEIMVNGVQVNPRSVKLPESNRLEGPEMKRFKRSIQKVDQEYTERRDRSKLAQVNGLKDSEAVTVR